MLRSIKDMLDYTILATDGEIGQVSDILLGDSDLKARYVVVETGHWLSGRKVLPRCRTPRHRGFCSLGY